MKKNHLIISCILLLALSLRFFGLNWDQGFHLHPDERMLIMVTERIRLFSQLNPDFFNYGSLPIYLLSVVSSTASVFGHNLVNYNDLLPIGRTLTVIADLITLLLIFKITVLLTKSNRTGYLASFLYAIAFFPIQNSHFFIVDPFLTLWITLLFYLSLSYSQNSSALKTILIGVISAAAVTTKFTAVLFLPVIPIVIALTGKTDRWKNIVLYLVSCIAFSFLFMPYAFIEYGRFLSDTFLQTTMSKDPYIFPYTLQYVDTAPYWYAIKNMVLWGLGPFISFFSIIGITYLIQNLFHQKKHLKKYLFQNKTHLTFLFITISYILYFLIIGQSAVKFMRYFLPLYPALCIAAAWGFDRLIHSSYRLLSVGAILILGLALVWTFSFMTIYTVPNTRVSATQWILDNIPPGSTLAVEHWDDRLPIQGSEQYTFEELQLYNVPDNDEKWDTIHEQLERSDYIIIASNRLYTPLQRLVDCVKYQKCYPKTNQYYKDLLSNRLPFQKIAEFYVHPLGIDDQSADESFTVYDHPKILIFQKNH